MDNLPKNQDFVRLAKQGDQQSLAQLAQTARPRLYTFVYRIVLNPDIADDIAQQTMLEMIKKLQNLRENDKFWPWLRAIALNFIKKEYSRRQRQKHPPLPKDIGQDQNNRKIRNQLDLLIGNELKSLVQKSISALSPKHRTVLVLRCYENLDYSQIAQQLDSSELAVRLIFCRAKKKLKAQLSKQGYKKNALLTVITLFAKLTAPDDTAAAQITINPATLSAGPIPQIITYLTSAAFLALVLTAILLALIADDLTYFAKNYKPAADITTPADKKLLATTPNAKAYPKLIMSLNHPAVKYLAFINSNQNPPMPIILENRHANYIFDPAQNTLTIKNQRTTLDQLANQFHKTNAEKILNPQALTNLKNFLILTDNNPKTTPLPDPSFTEQFHYPWPDSVTIIDQRDQLHKTGIAQLSITGQIASTNIHAKAILPLYPAAAQNHPPTLDIILSPTKNPDQKIKLTFRENHASRMFTGLCKPWQILAAVDSIRLDAAKLNHPCKTQYPTPDLTTLTVTTPKQNLIYTINNNTDLVEKLVIISADKTKTLATLDFSYSEKITQNPHKYLPDKSALIDTWAPGFGFIKILEFTQSQQTDPTK
jgi:RNA polymerase sigma-70 factor (ECF subfamily)